MAYEQLGDSFIEESDDVKKIGLILLLGAWLSSAGAADFCVTSSVELQTALTSAGGNGQDDTIRIAQGTYPVPTGGFFFIPTGAEDTFDLTVVGGFVFSGPPFNLCSQPVIQDPELTVLDGGSADRVLNIRLPQAGNVEVRNLSFINGLSNDAFGGGGLRLYQNANQTYAGTLTVERNIFLLNTAGGGGGLYIGALDGTETVNVRVLNNLFVGNQANVLSAGAGVIQVDSPSPRGDIILDPRPAMTLAHNTVVDNTDSQGTGGFWLIGNVTNLYVTSNNLWGNSGNDLEWSVSGPNRVLRNNNIQDLQIAGFSQPTLDIGNISVQPVYENCGPLCVDRIPVAGSPLTDSGYAPSGPPFQPWSLPVQDLNGESRVRGGQIDIGAYEGIGRSIFADRFQSP